MVKGAAAYKKKDGTLALSASQTEVTWTPAVTGAQPLMIPIASITSESIFLFFSILYCLIGFRYPLGNGALANKAPASSN